MVEDVECGFGWADFETPFGWPLLDVCEVDMEFLLDEFVIVVSYPGIVLFYLADVVKEDVEEWEPKNTPLKDSCLNCLGHKNIFFIYISFILILWLINKADWLKHI